MKRTVLPALAVLLAALCLQGCAGPRVSSTPDELYQNGETAFKKGNYEDAITNWKKVKESYQTPELTAKAEINIADAYFLNKEYIEAAAAYEDFRKLHPGHERAGFALYRQALSYYSQINGIDTDQTPVKNALVTFQSYQKLYPGGEFAAEVAEKVQDCRDKQLQYELYVGRFYLKTGKTASAVFRFESALKAFPGLPRCEEVLYYLGKAYQDTGEKPKTREVFERLVKEYPDSRYAAYARRAIAD